jgi:hypothetical protein
MKTKVYHRISRREKKKDHRINRKEDKKNSQHDKKLCGKRNSKCGNKRHYPT